MSWNFHLLIGVFVLIAFAIAVTIVLWIATKLLIWEVRRWRAQRQARRAKYRSDGTAYPPVSMGLCDRCERACEKVYHMPSGQRLCPDCYELLHGDSAAPAKTAQPNRMRKP